METSAHSVGTIPLTAFDLDAVARVTGLSISQLQRWDRTGFFHPALADPNRRRPGSRIYARDDVVALRLIAKLREAGVPLAQLKPLLRLIARDENGRWPACSFYVGGNRVFLERDDAVAASRQAGRQDGVTTIDVASMVAEVDEAIDRLHMRQPEQIGQVTRKRGIMQGVPIIAGTRIPTETIAWFHNNGYALDWILREFPRLTAQDVQAAVAFENEREVKNPDPVLARG